MLLANDRLFPGTANQSLPGTAGLARQRYEGAVGGAEEAGHVSGSHKYMVFKVFRCRWVLFCVFGLLYHNNLIVPTHSCWCQPPFETPSTHPKHASFNTLPYTRRRKTRVRPTSPRARFRHQRSPLTSKSLNQRRICNSRPRSSRFTQTHSFGQRLSGSISSASAPSPMLWAKLLRAPSNSSIG